MIPHWDLSVGILLLIQTPDCAVRRFLFSACTGFNHYIHVGMQIRLSSNDCKEFGGKRILIMFVLVCAHFWQLNGSAMTCNFIIYQQQQKKNSYKD